MPQHPPTPTWLRSDHFVARAIGRPVQRFLHVEAAGGVVLLVSTMVALAWANSPWDASYHDLWATELSITLGGHVIAEDLGHWVNDGLMALFFFVVGLEIKQELVGGQLARLQDALLPAIAALGGMLVPAVIYLTINVAGDGSRGWGIPMATDIAFAVGVLALLGSRVPVALKVLLLALAIVDDIGAIIVIAAFYSEEIDLAWALAALAGLGVIALMTRIKIWYTPMYVLVGTAVWFATFESGIHATIAGVALGLLAPARPLMPVTSAAAIVEDIAADGVVSAEEVRVAAFRLRESISVAERLRDLLHPWTSYVVIPVFALANAGVVLSSDALADAARSSVTIGIVAGLLLGKVVGITGAVLLSTKLGVASMPAGVTMRQIVGMAAIAGIGFTVSLFISGLAFESAEMVSEAKIGILVASVLAAVGGSVSLLSALPPGSPAPGHDDRPSDTA